jgi:sulfite exporter TauE/SafE
MLTTIRIYREYRRQGLRNAWHLAGMRRVVTSAANAAGVLLIAAGLALAAANKAEAIHQAADNRVAATLTGQAGEIDELRTLLAACLGDKEGAIFIGGQLHLCRAVPTGIRK